MIEETKVMKIGDIVEYSKYGKEHLCKHATSNPFSTSGIYSSAPNREYQQNPNRTGVIIDDSKLKTIACYAVKWDDGKTDNMLNYKYIALKKEELKQVEAKPI
jgi:hypothetical protein